VQAAPGLGDQRGLPRISSDSFDPGESSQVEIIVDRARSMVLAPFLGHAVRLKLT
jgi:hypothetical protein